MYTPIPARLVRACTVGLVSACTFLSASLAGPPIKNPKEVVVETHPMYLGTITGGVKTSDVYTEGNFSIVAPVWSTLGADATLSGDVVYLEPYTSWGERGEVAASLGLGWRHLFGSQSVSALKRQDAPQPGFFDEGIFVGANVFIDMLDTEADNQFWQLGVGLEVGTRYVEVRGNYYIPLSDKQLAEETRTVETIQRSSTTTSQSVTPTSDPYATGTSVAQNALFTTTATTTTSTTTIERLFRRYEEGMEGWDAEVALLIPGLDKYFDLRVIGGYYKFDNQPFGPQEGGTGNVEGWKAGVEIRPVPAVILTGTWYEDERLTGSDWTVGMQLQVPFEMGDLGDGKTFWSRIGDSFTPRRRHLVERLAEPVRRQNAAIKVANTVDTETNTDTSVKRVTKVVSQRPGQVVLEDDIIFVNNGAAVGNGIQAGTAQSDGATGTAERPFNTITEGALVAGTNSNTSGRLWTVYTQGGTGFDYDDYVEVTGSTRFTSSYVPIVGLGGRNFGGDTARPVLYGGFAALNINTLIVQGYDFRSGILGFGPSVFAANPSTLIVQDNLFTLGEIPPFEEIPELPEFEDLISFIFSSVSVLADSEGGTHNIIVQNNEFHDVFAALFVGSGYGYDLSDPEFIFSGCGCGGGSSPNVNILATNNYINDALFAGIYIDAVGGSKVNATISNSLFEGFFTLGTLVDTYDDAIVGVQLTNNIFDGYFDEVVSGFYSDNHSILNATLTGNSILGGSDYWTGFGFVSYGHAEVTATIADNSFRGESWDSVVDLFTYNRSIMNVTVSGNRFGGYNDDELIDIESYDRSRLDVDILDNRFPGEYEQLLDAGKYDRSILDLTFAGNNVGAEVWDRAFEIFGEGSHQDDSILKVLIQDNRFNGYYEEDFMVVAKNGDALVDVSILDNRFTGFFDERTLVLTSDGDSGPNNRLIANISGNRFRGFHDDEAIFLESRGDSKLDATVTNNIFRGYFSSDAVGFEAYDDSKLTVTFADNLLRRSASVDGTFMYAVSDQFSRLFIEGFDRNLVRGPVAVGFAFIEYGDSTMKVNGTLDPAATNIVRDSSGPEFISPEGNVGGQFFLNNSLVNP